MTTRTGQCMCGAVRFSTEELAEHFAICHCKTCQRWAGTSFKGVSAPTATLEIEGREHIAVFKSSGFAERAHCRSCGSTLWYRLTAGPYVGKTSLAVGLLDHTDGLTVAHEYFSDRTDSTHTLTGEHKQFTAADVLAMAAAFEDDA
ncbi:MAG: GFA family protein [Proteobacteria bacterium]|nr:GFA family protein [Pseudomonadota bacterium]